jgi:hypothetical protein
VIATETVTVLNPVGFPPAVEARSPAPRLADLDGSTIFLVDCAFVNADTFLEQMRLWFAENLPSVRTPIIRWNADDHGVDRETLDEIASGGDAAILGVGI